MVKIAIAGGSSQLAREVIEQLSATGKHQIIALVRKDPESFPAISGVEWVQTNCDNKTELVNILKGVHTVLSFIAVHLDEGNKSQKTIIDASIEAGAKRFAPSEWATGVKLETNLDAMPWYAGKAEVANYLKDINKDKKVIEYCRFQPGCWIDYISHPYPLSKHVATLDFVFNFTKGTAIVVEESLDKEITFTSTPDIAKVVVKAVDYDGEWPVIGGISGDRTTPRKLLEIGEQIYGKSLDVDWLHIDDLEAGELKTDNYPRLEMPSIPKDQAEAFARGGIIGMLRAYHRGLWTVSDEWNKLLPDVEFAKVEDTLLTVWGKK